jgi:hypothetical protein
MDSSRENIVEYDDEGKVIDQHNIKDFNQRMSTPKPIGGCRTKNELKQYLKDVKEAKKELVVEKVE